MGGPMTQIHGYLWRAYSPATVEELRALVAVLDAQGQPDLAARVLALVDVAAAEAADQVARTAESNAARLRAHAGLLFGWWLRQLEAHAEDACASCPRCARAT